MAAKFGFKITAEDKTKRDVDSAEKGLGSLGKTGVKVGKMLTAAFAGFSLVAITKGINSLTDAFGEQEKAELRLIAAAKNNPYLNGDSVRGLTKTAAALQKISVFGDEAIIQQQAFLSTLQFTEEQITGVLDAAVDLASTGIVSLDGAVKNIAKTYAGMTGELGELIPTLKELTVEELKAGGAVDMISESYAGMAEAAASGVSGAKLQVQNMIGDLKESVGEGIAPAFKLMLERVQPHIQTLIDWFSEHANQIANFFVGFPEIAMEAFNLVRDILKRAFSFDFFTAIVPSVFDYVVNQFRAAMEYLGAIADALGATIWEPLKTGFEWVAYAIRSAFRVVATALFNVFDKIVIGPINAVISGLESIVNAAKTAGAAVSAFFQHPFSKERRQAAFRELIAAQTKTEFGGVSLSGPDFGAALVRPSLDVDKITGAWKKAFEALPAFASSTWNNIKNLAGDIRSEFKDLTDGFGDKVGTILNRELDDKVASPLLKLAADLEDNTEEVADAIKKYTARDYLRQVWGMGYRYTPEGAGFNNAAAFLNQVQGLAPRQVPGAADYLNQVQGTGSPLQTALFEITELLGGFGGMLLEAAMGLESVVMLADPLKLILQGFIQTIAGPLNAALAPLVGIFITLGNLLGNIVVPIINLLAPVIQKLAELFVWLYNKVLLPIGKLLIGIFTVVYDIVAGLANAVIAILNGVIGLINKIPGINIGLLGSLAMASPMETAASLQEISLGSVTAAGSGGISAEGGTVAGSGASFAGGHNVTINFQINTDVLVGDRRELVEWISDEIRDAIELGAVVA